ncbi:DNA-binding transcription factor [Didymella keratinophila]|nr:DNA-binding transcription factor [Didymella keratinophila]
MVPEHSVSRELFEDAIEDHVEKTRGMRTQDLPGDGESGLQKGENMAVGEDSWDSSAATTSMEEKKKGKGAVEEESLLTPRQSAQQYAEPELDDVQYDEQLEFYSDEEVEHHAGHAYGAYGAHPRPETDVDPEIPSTEQDMDLEDASAQQQFLPQFTIANFDHISSGGSPTISPRLIPQGAHSQDPEAIPSLNDFGQADTMSPSEINIDFAPPSRQAYIIATRPLKEPQ